MEYNLITDVHDGRLKTLTLPVAALMERCLDEELRGSVLLQEFPREYFVRRIASYIVAGCLCIATEDDVVVGVGFIVNSGINAEICSLFVSEEHRKEGVGKSIIELLTEYGKMHGVQNVTLDVMSNNTRALSFYERLGFKEFRVGLQMRIQGDNNAKR